MSTCWRRLSLGHPDGEAWRLTGRSQGTDRSEERQHFVDRSEGQETLGAPGTDILACPSLCESGTLGAPAPAVSLSL